MEEPISGTQRHLTPKAFPLSPDPVCFLVPPRRERFSREA